MLLLTLVDYKEQLADAEKEDRCGEVTYWDTIRQHIERQHIFGELLSVRRINLWKLSYAYR